MSAVKDLTGMTFGRWKVLGPDPAKYPDGRKRWICQCQCEAKTEKSIIGKNLLNGISKSCGCLKRETLAARNSKSGLSKTHLYKIFKSMNRYGDICDDWKGYESGLENFIAWANENGYKEGMSIRRIRPNMVFSPTNCVFYERPHSEKHVKAVSMKPIKDLTGKTFGRLKVIGPGPSYRRADGESGKTWECECQCENKTHIFVPTDKLTSGQKNDCGCVYREKVAMNAYKSDINREALKDFKPFWDMSYEDRTNAYNRIYGIHKMMIARCEDPKQNKYYLYGGKGIKVCKEWKGKAGFINFFKWSITHGYDVGLSIDRRDSDGNYCSENCRWITVKEQANNTSRNNYIYDGEEMLTFAEFDNKYDDSGKIYSRFSDGWSHSAIVEAAKHKELGLHMSRKGRQYLDSDGFIVLIPKINQKEK